MNAYQFVLLGSALAVSALAAVDGGSMGRWLTEIGTAALLVTAATLFWTLRLQWLVQKRTAELEAKNLELERESSDRRQALEALQLTEKRLLMAMQAAQLLTWHWDVVTDRFEVVGDRPPDHGPIPAMQRSGMAQFLEPIHPDDIAAVRAAIGRAIQHGDSISSQFRVVFPNGEVRWKVARGCAVRDGGGTVVALVGVVLDNTDRRRNEEELSRSEERYRELFENANDIIYTHDLTGNFTSINNAAERVLGYSRSEVLRLNVRDVVAPEDVETATRMIARKVAGDASRTEYELHVRAKDGRRVTLEVNTRLVVHRGEIVAVQGIARDVTERKRLEWQLGQSQKMEAVGQLAGGIAHDFNNLLTAILGNAQLAQLNETLTPQLRECLSEMAGASHRAAALTRQLLVFSRHEQIDRRPLSLPDTLGDFMKMLRRIIGEHIEVCLVTSSDVPSVLADPAQIEQVALNLAVNARDAMPRGGRLLIEVDEVVLPQAHGAVAPSMPPGPYVRLRFTDTGCGMEPEVCQRVFEPFFTTKPVGEGTGLGLAVVYGIVKQHDGCIDVTSVRGKGTQFTVHLPAVDVPVPPRREPVHTDASRGGSGTILIAEDEDALRRLAERLLTGLGYSVITAADGAEAMALFAQRRDEIDLLLLDVVMPRKGGPDVYAWVRENGSDVPVVFMTGYSADVAPHDLGTETGSRVLCKPYDLDALANVVREVLLTAGV